MCKLRQCGREYAGPAGSRGIDPSLQPLPRLFWIYQRPNSAKYPTIDRPSCLVPRAFAVASHSSAVPRTSLECVYTRRRNCIEQLSPSPGICARNRLFSSGEAFKLTRQFRPATRGILLRHEYPSSPGFKATSQNRGGAEVASGEEIAGGALPEQAAHPGQRYQDDTWTC
jgi:hypothetical protein